MELQVKSENYTNHIRLINKGLGEGSDFYIADESEYDDIHDLLENEAMELSNYVKLKYSRRPNLFSSYLESGQTPAIITDKEKRFLGVVSEMNISRYGQSVKTYYTSDLRISKKAGMRTRANFRKSYLEVLKNLPGECYTVVLKDNEKAINALAKNQKNIFYNKVYEYTSNSILILPTLSTLRDNLKNLEIVRGEDLTFVSKLKQESIFANEVSSDDISFLIRSDGETIGQFSIKRPALRNLYAEPGNKRTSFWLKLIKTLFKHDYESKIPWVYLTSLYLKEGEDESPVMKKIIRFLYFNKYLKIGELFLFCYGRDEDISLRLPTPQFITHGNVYKVSDQAQTEKFNSPVYLNPLSL